MHGHAVVKGSDRPMLRTTLEPREGGAREGADWEGRGAGRPGCPGQGQTVDYLIDNPRRGSRARSP